MRVHVLQREQRLAAPPGTVFPFFADPANLEAITPPLLRFSLITPPPVGMGPGTFLQYALRIHGVPVRWDTLIQAWEPPHRFVDVQVRGPYRLWHHTHELEPIEGGTATLMRDTVRYAVGFGPAGEIVRRAIVLRDLEEIFAFRAERIPGLLRDAGVPALGGAGRERVEDEVRARQLAQ
jgi:ligand-binding SRPBCC domain-containing protein